MRTASGCRASSSASFATTLAVAFWRVGRLSQTQYILRRTPERVRIMRHAHPLHGCEVHVLIEGDKRIVIQLEDGTSMRIPRAWTDADGSVPSAREITVFTSASLDQVLSLVAAFLQRA